MDKTVVTKLRPKLRSRTAPQSEADRSLECNICLDNVDREYKLVRYGCCEGKMCRSCCITLTKDCKFTCPCCRKPSPFAAMGTVGSTLRMTMEEEPIIQSHSRSIRDHQRLRVLHTIFNAPELNIIRANPFVFDIGSQM
jgi:hypothetical protein